MKKALILLFACLLLVCSVAAAEAPANYPEIRIDPLVDIAAQYGKIRSNLNQIAHYLNSTGIWSQRLLDNLTGSLQEMYATTKKLAKVVDEINGDYKTQGNEKFRL